MGRADWLYILLQDNDLKLTLPWLLFPLAVLCGIGYHGDRRQMGWGRDGWGHLHRTLTRGYGGHYYWRGWMQGAQMPQERWGIRERERDEGSGTEALAEGHTSLAPWVWFSCFQWRRRGRPLLVQNNL